MKKSIFLFFAAILCATSAWSVDVFKDGQYIYYQMTGNSNWTQATYVPMFGWYWDSGNWCNKELGKEVPGTDKAYYYQIVPNAYIGYVQIMRMNGSNTSEEWNYSNKKGVPADKTQNCYYFKSASWSGGDLSIKTYAPPMSSVTLADNGTTVNSGTGAQADPYIIEIGTKIKVQASGTKAVDDPDAVINYAFKYGATSQDSETTTWEIDANSPSTTYAIELEGYTKVNTTSSEKKAATKLYYQTVADATLPTYQVTVTANNPAMGTVTGAGEYSEGATAELTATPNDGYKFVNWTVGSTEKSTNPTYSFMVIENVTLVANFQAIPEETVYFINTNEWIGTINAYAWTDGTPKVENAGWAGLAATKEDFQIGGYDVYSYTAKQGLYANVIFNGTGGQTTDLTWQAGKYYAPSKEKWYDTKEAAAEALATPLADETVYFVNNKEWASVAIYGWGGTASTSEGIGKWAGADMTKTAEQVAGFDVYSYTAKEGTVKNILFNYNGDENKTSNFVWTNGKYYYMDAGAQKDKNYAGGTKEEVAEIVAIPVVDNYYVSGTFNSWASNDAAKLTLNGGLYTKELTLEAGAHMFKVQKNNWAGEWGYSNIKGAYVGMEEGTNDDGDKNNNIKLTLSTKTTFTVKFNLADNEITFDGLTEDETETLVYTVEVPEGTEKCYIAGKMNNWEFALMTQKDATHWTITYDNVLKDMKYKYACQASWDYVEKDKDGNDLADDRTWKENDKVEKWGKPVIVTYQLKGVGGWDQPGIELVQNPGNDKEYMLTCQAISATDAIKVVRLEDGVIKEYYGNGTVKDGVEVSVSYDADANIKLPAGTYNFYFDTNESEKKLWIAAATDCVTEPTPDYTRAVTPGNLGTICLPFNVPAGKASGATFYTLAGKDANGRIAFDEVNGELAAGVSYLFQATATEIVCFYGTESVLTPDEDGAMKGTFVDLELTELSNIYYFAKNALWSCVDLTELIVPANRAYVDMSRVTDLTEAAPVGVRRITLGVNGAQVATGVDQVEGNEVPTKMIINGQLFILRGEKMYDAQGKLVK